MMGMKTNTVPTYIKSLFWLLIFAATPYCLSLGQDSKVIVGQIDESSRVAFASQTLGNKKFQKLANIHPERGELETFILSQLKKSLHGAIQIDHHELTNTIIAESNDAGIDPLFVMSVIQHESRFRTNAVGSRGEIGLMQIMPATAIWLSQENDIPYTSKNDLYDPVTNVRMGIHYIAWLRQKFPKTKDLATAYNMGPKHLKKALKEKRSPTIYYSKVLHQYLHMYAEAQSLILAKNIVPKVNLVAAYTPSPLIREPVADNN
jgi:soluble lytic murein transglycosylase